MEGLHSWKLPVILQPGATSLAWSLSKRPNLLTEYAGLRPLHSTSNEEKNAGVRIGERSPTETVAPSLSTDIPVNMDTESFAQVAIAPARNSSSAFKGFYLWIYDFLALFFANWLIWDCPTATNLLPLFRYSLGTSHLDIGVGTGYYTQTSHLPPSTKVTLCDLSPTALEKAERRIAFPQRGGTLLANCLEPLPTAQKFDSISMFYLLHCLPGPFSRKAKVFSTVKRNLAADGVCIGATILRAGQGTEETAMSYWSRWWLLRNGIIDNEGDDRRSMEEALRLNFEEVESWMVGKVLLWRARGPSL